MSQQRLTDRVIAPYITGDTLIHIVNTGDTIQYSGGSSYKATIDQVGTYISQVYNTFTTGATFNGSIIEFDRNNLTNAYSVDISSVNTDNYTTGGTYNSITEEIDFVGTNGSTTFSVDVSALLDDTNTYVTGGTFSLGTLTLERNDGNSVIVTGFTSDNYYTTGATLSGNTIVFDRNDLSNAYSVNLSGLTTDTNFANTNLTFTGNREHNTNGNSFQITTDGGNFLQNFIYLSGNVGIGGSEFGFGSSYTDWRSTSVDHYLSGVKRIEVLTSETVFNNSGGNYDFRVEGDTDQNLFFIDASTDNVGIGTNSPSEKLDISGKTKTINFQMTSGATTGYVLTSDASGNASWQVPTGGGGFSGGTVTGVTIFNNGISATTISATTIGSPTDCVEDLYVSNIHSCSPLNINPLDEGNVYFGSTSGVTIDLNNNRVGIGTTTPSQRLDVNGVTRHRGSVIMDNTRNISWTDTSLVFPTSLDNKILWSLNNDTAQLYAFQPITDKLDFVFKVTDNTSGPSSDEFVYWVDSVNGEQDDSYPLSMGQNFIINPTRRYALSASTSGAGTTSFYILQSGATSLSQSVLFANTSTRNVGIGTTTPATSLDVTGVANSLQARFGNIANRGLEISTVAISGRNDAGVILNGTGDGSNGTLIFQTEDVERVRIDVNGLVGIGTNSPTEKLDVSGKTKTTNFQMTSGATDGYVLTSDASGNATWQSGADVNIYNSDGTLIGNRTVDLDGFQLTFGDGTGSAVFNGQRLLLNGIATDVGVQLQAADTQEKQILFQSNNMDRFKISVKNFESGGESGSAFFIECFDDLGNLLSIPLSIFRSNGALTISNAYELPTTDGTAGQVLTTDGGGFATWQTSSVGVSIDPYNNVGSTGTSFTWNVSGLSTNYQVTLTANTTLNLTNVRNGDYGTIIVTQDVVGSRAITFGTVNGGVTTHRVVNGGGGSPVLTSNANAIDILTFTYNGSTMFWTVGNDYT